MLKLFATAQALAVDAARALRRHEEGQTMAEYGVVLSVITLLVVASISLLSDKVRTSIEGVASILHG